MPSFQTPHRPATAPQPTTRFRLPAFGRELMELREQGLIPADGMCIVSLDSWAYGKGRARVVVTPDVEPDSLDFSFTAAIDVTLVHVPTLTSIERRDACIRALLRCNPTRLLVCTISDVIKLTWIKSRSVGIELEEFQ